MTKKIIIFALVFGLVTFVLETLIPPVFIYTFSILLLLTVFLFFTVLVTFNHYHFKNVLKGAPFVQTDSKKVETIVNIAKKLNTKNAIDLGSGNGRIILALGAAGIKSKGVEISSILVWNTKQKIKRSKLSNLIQVEKKDLWQENLEKFDLVVLFGIYYIMKDLEKKILKECKPGTTVVSNKFEFENLNHANTENGIYVYRV